MYTEGQTIHTTDGRIMTIMETIRLRNRKRHLLLTVSKTRSGGRLLGDKITNLSAKALRKLEAKVNS